MAGYQDENPYASPEGAGESANTEAAGGVWRDGDEVVMLTRRSESPRACWVTNQEGPCWRWGISYSLRADVGIFLIVFLPVVGMLFFLLILWLSHRQDRILKGLRIWLLWRRAAICHLATALASLIGVVGLAASNVAFLESNVVSGLLAILCIGVALLLLLSIERGFGLVARRDEKGVFHVRGVHPDYLARLPAYNEADVRAAMSGESSFVEWR